MNTNYTSLYINGFRGTGKSTLGALISEALGWDYCDMDRAIARRAQKSISEITNNGTDWQEFRQLEHELFKTLLKRKHIVVTTGGGTAVNAIQKKGMSQTFGEINAALMKQQKDALCIVLIAEETIIADRIRNHEKARFNKPAMRPILNEQYAKKIQKLLNQYKNDPEKQKELLIEHIVADSLEIFKHRKPIYMQLTNHIIDTGKLSIEQTVETILSIANN